MRYYPNLLLYGVFIPYFVMSGIVCRPEKKSSIPVPLLKAHAHNDYEHTHPLFDALSQGFTSIEADIHFINDRLYIAHDEVTIDPVKTLQTLYLDPLRVLIQKNNGSVYINKTPFLLFIDFKTEAESTYSALRSVLKTYGDILTSYEQNKRINGAVDIIISGNRPIRIMTAENNRMAGYDGRLEDMESDVSSHLMPVISDNWIRHFNWMGKGKIPLIEKEKLERIVQKVHAKGRLIRFWATDVNPLQDQINLWDTLLEAGVDLINTDKLQLLATFLQGQLKNRVY